MSLLAIAWLGRLRYVWGLIEVVKLFSLIVVVRLMRAVVVVVSLSAAYTWAARGTPPPASERALLRDEVLS